MSSLFRGCDGLDSHLPLLMLYELAFEVLFSQTFHSFCFSKSSMNEISHVTSPNFQQANSVSVSNENITLQLSNMGRSAGNCDTMVCNCKRNGQIQQGRRHCPRCSARPAQAPSLLCPQPHQRTFSPCACLGKLAEERPGFA